MPHIPLRDIESVLHKVFDPNGIYQIRGDASLDALCGGGPNPQGARIAKCKYVNDHNLFQIKIPKSAFQSPSDYSGLLTQIVQVYEASGYTVDI